MSYIRVRWLHNHPDEPVWLISELDGERWETRKVEIFPNGSKGFADGSCEVGGTRLGEVPIPPPHLIAADVEFVAEEISKKEFEAIWAERSNTV
jgi:hypothetical protein